MVSSSGDTLAKEQEQNYISSIMIMNIYRRIEVTERELELEAAYDLYIDSRAIK